MGDQGGKDACPLYKIISGGQTGADRAGLEVGKRLGYKTGGTVPKGYRTSAGPDPGLKEFDVIEDASHRYPPRTVRNVTDSDGTVWFGNTETPGGRLTLGTARKLGKPLLVNPAAERLHGWIRERAISVLNVAGDRETNSPGIQAAVEEILLKALGPTKTDPTPSGD